MARALVLTAGGVTGALYEVGVLRAVEERYGSPLDLFDLFVGISAGASVFLANPMGLVARREVLEGGLSRGRAVLAAGQLALEAA